MVRFFSLLLLAITLVCCVKKDNYGYKIYTIREGTHMSSQRMTWQTSNRLSFDAVFLESCKYTTQDPVNQQDINKLYGFSDCNDNHQKNSARFGWRWYNDTIEVFGYVYNDGERDFEYINSVATGDKHHYDLTMSADKYIFQLDTVIVEMDRTANCESGFYYKLFPYFGGDETAPHEIKIKIKETIGQ